MKRDGLEKRPLRLYKTRLNLNHLTRRKDANIEVKMTTYFLKITVTKACSHYNMKRETKKHLNDGRLIIRLGVS